MCATRAMMIDEIEALKKELAEIKEANIWLNREVSAGDARLETLREDRDQLLVSHKNLNNEYTKSLEFQKELQNKLRSNLRVLTDQDQVRFILERKLRAEQEKSAQLLDEVRFWEDEHERQETIIDALIFQLKHKG